MPWTSEGNLTFELNKTKGYWDWIHWVRESFIGTYMLDSMIMMV